MLIQTIIKTKIKIENYTTENETRALLSPKEAKIKYFSRPNSLSSKEHVFDYATSTCW
jgi:hypothetical protein